MSVDNSGRGSVSRRNLLKGAAGITGGLALASFANILGAREAFANHDRMDDVATIANLAATAETLAATSYYYTILNTRWASPAMSSPS